MEKNFTAFYVYSDVVVLVSKTNRNLTHFIIVLSNLITRLFFLSLY